MEDPTPATPEETADRAKIDEVLERFENTSPLELEGAYNTGLDTETGRLLLLLDEYEDVRARLAVATSPETLEPKPAVPSDEEPNVLDELKGMLGFGKS